MSETTATQLDEGERLRLLASMQSLERLAAKMRGWLEDGNAEDPKALQAEYDEVLQSWFMAKTTLHADEGEYAHVGRDWLESRD